MRHALSRLLGRPLRYSPSKYQMALPCALVLAACAMVPSNAMAQANPVKGKIRVLVTVGGHDYEKQPFDAMLEALPDVVCTQAVLPKDMGLLAPGLEKNYDVLVRYDIAAPSTPEQRTAFQELLRKGIGLVALHHNECVQRDWPEYYDIIGMHVNKTWQEGLEMPIAVVDPNHPVTQGVDKEFVIHDETYAGYSIDPKVHVLLKTSHPKNDPAEIAWTTQYGKSPVVYLMLGHDGGAYGNPNYRRLLHNAILWTAAESKKNKS